MASAEDIATKPVEDLGHKINGVITVGEDLEFQRRWWRFEDAVWIFFALLIVLDVLGVFGRGWAAKARAGTSDGALNIRYERVERTMTPSTMRVQFSPDAASDGKYKLYVSDGLVNGLGNARIAPQPESSAVGRGGFVYTFPALGEPAVVTFSLEPSAPGLYHWQIGIPGGETIEKPIVVLP